MRKELKKSAIDLTDLAIGIVILGVVVSIGSYVLITTRDSRLTDLATSTTSNESTWINGTTDTFTNTWVKSVDACYCNVTGTSATAGCTVNATVPAANYSLSISPVDGVGTLSNTTAVVFPDAACTYTTYDTTRADWALADDAATGIGEYSNWFKIIVIVGVAAVILSLVFMAFGRRNGTTVDY